LVFGISFLSFPLAVWFGNTAKSRYRSNDAEISDDLGLAPIGARNLLTLKQNITPKMSSTNSSSISK
jgi:hypothetical protein